MGYTNRSFPTAYQISDGDVKEVLYYDDYGFNTDVNYNFDVTNAFGTQGLAKGMVTGKLIRNVKTNTWQKMVMYYDFKGRILEEFHLTNLNKLIRKDHSYRFTDELIKSRIVKKNGTVTISTKSIFYAYDHAGRKIGYKHGINEVLQNIANYEYNSIGQLSVKAFKKSDVVGSFQTGNWTDINTWLTKSLPTLSDIVTINTGQTITIPTGESASAGKLVDNGVLRNFGKLNFGKTSAAPLYEMSYKYHIRNGLKGINTDTNNDLNNTLFSFRLDYENDGILYDGNIRNQYWKSNIDGIKRAYEYSYDGDSRLTGANYGSEKAGENYALSGITYDFNGNIKTLSRNGYKSNNTFGVVDNLNYTYNTNSNKLLKVEDISTETASFKDVAGNDYEYWLDGSLKKDNNKEITQIDYNYLKLPEKINLTGGRWIEYEYDASGVKLKKTLSTGKYTDYEEDEIFENGVLYQTSHDEGRIVDGIYEYNIKDHLGNLRVAFKDSSGIAKITQVNAYGAFGDDLPTLKYINSTKKNRFGFNAKEEENDFGIGYTDFKWRFSDQILGRFFTIDRLAEKFSNISTYQFASNDPINKLEIDGLEGVRHTEVNTQGNTIRHIVALNVGVVTVDNWKKSENNGQKEPRDRAESSLKTSDVKNISDNLNMMFNGSDGRGAKNSAGELVFFQFNVKEVNVGKHDATTTNQLMNNATNNGIESGEKDPQSVYSKSSDGNLIAPTNLILGARPSGAYARADNNNVRTKLGADETNDPSTLMHETVHQLLRRTTAQEHGLGGAMANPPESLSPKNVDAILQDAFKAKQPIVIIK